jgi:hypothetical protein
VCQAGSHWRMRNRNSNDGASRILQPATIGRGVAFVGAVGLVVIVVSGCRLVPSADQSPQRVDIVAVTARDPSHVFAVGGTEDDQGTLVTAAGSDAGATWTVAARPYPPFASVAWAGERLLASTRCMPRSVGGQAIDPTPTSCLFESADGGTVWTDLGAGRLVEPSIAPDGLHGWAHAPVGSSTPGLFLTGDGGRTWAPRDSPCPAATPVVTYVSSTGPNTGYVLCYATAPQSGEATLSWALLEVASDNVHNRLAGATVPGEAHGLRDDYVHGIAMRDDGTGLLWANDGLYRTTDHAQTWVSAGLDPADGTFWGTGVVLPDEVAFLTRRSVGNFTAVYGTSDGATWQELVSWPYFGVGG